MARDSTKLTSTDARVFALLTDGPVTARQVATEIHRAENTALRSLQRLVLHGLATAAASKRVGFATGNAALVWTMVPGAVFPGPAPRKKYTLQITGRPQGVARQRDDSPPLRIKRKGAVPAEVAQAVGLAGLVQQMVGKD